jgi:hypothetical protein
VLSLIQQHLQDLYELDITQDVHDFLVTCKDLQDTPSYAPRRSNCREQLLLLQDKDDLHLSLYLHTGVVENLSHYDTAMEIHEDNLEDFCLALEGISHFLYVIWNARYDRSITMLEMELQAEVDKFIVLSGCLNQQISRHDSPGKLRQLLFGSTTFGTNLTTEELHRYQDAGNYAKQYCRHLESRFSLFSEGREQALLNELRRFYRLGLGEKLRRINSVY